MRHIYLFIYVIYSIITKNSVCYCIIIVKNRETRTCLLGQFIFNVFEEQIHHGIYFTRHKAKFTKLVPRNTCHVLEDIKLRNSLIGDVGKCKEIISMIHET